MAGSRDDLIADYLEAGLALVPIPHGEKGPTVKGWNLQENCIRSSAEAGRLNGNCNLGLAHAYCEPSPTCAIDVDDIEKARPWMEERGIDLDALLNAPDAVRIESGRPGLAKLLYRLPQPLPSCVVAGGGLELRCASQEGKTVQDVLPPSIHPDTCQPYHLAGDIANIPPIPDALARAWEQANRATQQAELPLDLANVDQQALAARLAAVQADPDLHLLYKGAAPLWLLDKSRNGFDFALALTLNRLHFTPDQIAACLSNYEHGKLERHTDEKYIGSILRKVCAPPTATDLVSANADTPSWLNLTLKDGATSIKALHKAVEPWPYSIDPIRPRKVVTILGGANGLGKSTEALWQEMDTASGRDHYGMAVTQGRAIFISCEDPRALIESRIRARLDEVPKDELSTVEKALEDYFFYFGSDEMEGMKLTIKDFAKCAPSREAVEQLVALGQGAVSITVETVAMMNSGDEMNTDLMQLILALKEVARRTGASVQAVHHISKDARDRKPDSYSLRGGGSLVDAARSVTVMQELSPNQMDDLNITRVDGMPVIGLYHVKSSYSMPHPPVYLRRTPGPKLLQVNTSEAKGKEHACNRLMQYMQKQENREGVSVRHLKDNCTKFKIEKREVEGVLLKLEALGRVERTDSTALGRGGPRHDIWMLVSLL